MQEGYRIVKGIISKETCRQIKKSIDEQMVQCASDIGCSVEEYLASVSRWASPSPVCVPAESIVETVKEHASKVIGNDVSLNRMNIICKNAYNCGPIPFHQDISYSPSNPYQFSGWLALDDVTDDCGPLEVVPKSHLEPVEPPVDFWSLDYCPDKIKYQSGLRLPIEAGDIIFFDSRLWHGSGPNRAKAQRYALVTRWSTASYTPPHIPQKPNNPFGMWTCGDATKKILKEALEIEEEDFAKLLDHAKATLDPQGSRAAVAIDKVKILHLAHQLHNGGDAGGTLYRELYRHFLTQLPTPA